MNDTSIIAIQAMLSKLTEAMTQQSQIANKALDQNRVLVDRLVERDRVITNEFLRTTTGMPMGYAGVPCSTNPEPNAASGPPSAVHMDPFFDEGGPTPHAYPDGNSQ